MKKVMGIINVQAHDDLLGELTDFRCIASVPFGGGYCLIDFILSSMANSGIHNIAVFAFDKYRSLMDHLESGISWDLNRREDGLRILVPNSLYPRLSNVGDIKSFYSQMDFFERSKQEIVIISPGNLVCNMDFREAVRFHQEKGADITIFYREEAGQDPDDERKRKLMIGKDGRIIQIEEGQENLQGNIYLVELYIMSKTLLIETLTDSIMNGAEDLLQDVIIKEQDKLRLYAYPVKGFFAAVSGVKRYYKINMELLDPAVRQSLFSGFGVILTNIKDEPPVKYGAAAEVENSLLANGCLVEGRVENSILFSGVRVKKGAFVKNSIIMHNGGIEEDARVECAILDKEVNVSKGKEVAGKGANPVIIGKRKKL